MGIFDFSSKKKDYKASKTPAGGVSGNAANSIVNTTANHAVVAGNTNDEIGSDTATMDNQVLLFGAIESGDKESVASAIANGADINANNKDGQTPLVAALSEHYCLEKPVKAGRKDISKLLIIKGADLGATDTYGSTPLHLVSEYGYRELAELLIARGANVNASRPDGATPLINAIYNSDKDLVELLIVNGADTKVKDKDEITPANIALRKGNFELAEYIVSKGNDTNELQKFYAEIVLNNKDYYIREKAIGKLANLGLLKKIANCVPDDNEDNSFFKQVADIKVCNDQSKLCSIALKNGDWRLRKNAVEQLTDQSLIWDIVSGKDEKEVRCAAVARITDQKKLLDIYENGADAGMRWSALNALTDAEILLSLFNKMEDVGVRCNVAEKLSDEDMLKHVAVSTFNQDKYLMFTKNDYRLLAINKITNDDVLFNIYRNTADMHIAFIAAMKIISSDVIEQILSKCSTSLLDNELMSFLKYAKVHNEKTEFTNSVDNNIESSQLMLLFKNKSVIDLFDEGSVRKFIDVLIRRLSVIESGEKVHHLLEEYADSPDRRLQKKQDIRHCLDTEECIEEIFLSVKMRESEIEINQDSMRIARKHAYGNEGQRFFRLGQDSFFVFDWYYTNI